MTDATDYSTGYDDGYAAGLKTGRKEGDRLAHEAHQELVLMSNQLHKLHHKHLLEGTTP